MDISIKLKQLRHEKGLTQKELADNTGLSYAAIAAYEKALRNPNAKAMAALEQFFGVTAAELLSEKNENEENFGDFLRNVRKSQDMTQKEFAKKLCIGQPYLSGLECNRITPTPKLVKLIHLEFNIPYYDNRKPPLKAIVRRIKKNLPKPTSSGNDKIDFLASCVNRASENLSENNNVSAEKIKRIREMLKEGIADLEDGLSHLENCANKDWNNESLNFFIQHQAYELIKDVSNSMLTKVWKV